jgi:hypothetical protein
MSEDLERTAELIAQRGREALLARLRPAFQEAAAAHADVLELTSEQLEEMVQRAADRADGLQWRRALASVACEELRIPLSEALSHSAVARAQDLVGAPSYEESLLQLARAADAGREPQDEAAREQAADAVAEFAEEAAVAEEAEFDEEAEFAEAEGEWEQEPPPTMQYELEEIDDDAQGGHQQEDVSELQIAAVHIGGIANLSPGERGIELKLGEPGLDIVRADGEVLGRLEWELVQTLEVPPPRRRRRRGAATHLVIRTRRGDASFEVPGLTQDELREHLTPVLELYLPGID